MKKAIAIRTFRRSDTLKIVRQSEVIEGEDSYIDDLIRGRLARNFAAHERSPEVKLGPTEAASTESSASQAAQVSPDQTADSSEAGEKKTKRKKVKAEEASS